MGADRGELVGFGEGHSEAGLGPVPLAGGGGDGGAGVAQGAVHGGETVLQADDQSWSGLVQLAGGVGHRPGGAVGEGQDGGGALLGGHGGCGEGEATEGADVPEFVAVVAAVAGQRGAQVRGQRRGRRCALGVPGTMDGGGERVALGRHPALDRRLSGVGPRCSGR